MDADAKTDNSHSLSDVTKDRKKCIALKEPTSSSTNVT